MTEDADREVAQAGHGSGRVAGADLGGVLGVGDVADVVQRLDRPVAADVAGYLGWPGLHGGEAGDGVYGDRAPLLRLLVADPAGDPDGLHGVREVQAVAAEDLHAAALGAALPTGVGLVLNGNLPPWPGFHLSAHVGPVALTRADAWWQLSWARAA